MILFMNGMQLKELEKKRSRNFNRVHTKINKKKKKNLRKLALCQNRSFYVAQSSSHTHTVAVRNRTEQKIVLNYANPNTHQFVKF